MSEQISPDHELSMLIERLRGGPLNISIRRGVWHLSQDYSSQDAYGHSLGEAVRGYFAHLDHDAIGADVPEDAPLAELEPANEAAQ